MAAFRTISRTVRSLGWAPVLLTFPTLGAAQPTTADAPAPVEPSMVAQDGGSTPPLGESFPESGFEWGLGVGFAMPFGDADSGASLFDTGGQAPNSGLAIRDGTMAGLVSYRVPFVLDLGYRFSRAWWVGLRPEFGTGGFGTECPTGANCNWTDARLGAVAKLHLDPMSHSDPWLALNVGWEWMRPSVSVLLPPEVTGLTSSQSVSAKQTVSGPLLELLGGLSFDFGENIHAGPFVSAAVGRYLRSSFDCPSAALGCPTPAWIRDGAFHAWLSVGIAASHGP